MSVAEGMEMAALVRCEGVDFGLGVTGDNLGCPDKVVVAKRLGEIGYDERRGVGLGEESPSLLDELRRVVSAVNISVGGRRRHRKGLVLFAGVSTLTEREQALVPDGKRKRRLYPLDGATVVGELDI